MGTRTILIVDDDLTYLGEISEYLRSHGFNVRTASQLEEARRILDEEWVHLAIIDKRLRGGDMHDRSGILLAQETTHQIPKIIVSLYEIDQREVRELLRWRDKSIAADCLSKSDDLEELVSAVNYALLRHEPINWDLAISGRGRLPITIPHLVKLINPTIRDELLGNHSEEFSDLLRKVFAGYKSIELSKILWQQGNRLAITAFALQDLGGEQGFVLVCGLTEAAKKEEALLERGNRDLAINSGSTCSEFFLTTHYGAHLYNLTGCQNIDQAHTLMEAFEWERIKPLLEGLDSLFDVTLMPWYNQKIQFVETDLGSLYRRLTGIEPSGLEERLQSCYQVLVPQLKSIGLRLDINKAQMSLGFPNQELLYFPNPLPCIRHQYTIETPISTIPIPGIFNGEDILLDKQAHTWLTDFGNIQLAPQFWVQISLEAAVRYDWGEAATIQERCELETCLVESEFSLQSYKNIKSPLAKNIQVIRYLRQSKNVAPDEKWAYQLGVFFQAARRMLKLEPGKTLYRNELAQYTQVMLSMALLAGKLNLANKLIPPRPRIEIDEDKRLVYVGERREENILKLSRDRYMLICYFKDNAERVCTYQEVIENVYKEKYDEFDRSQKERVSKAISRLRDNLAKKSGYKDWFVPVPGMGYRLY